MTPTTRNGVSAAFALCHKTKKGLKIMNKKDKYG